MSFDTCILWSIFLLTTFLLGYSLGRRVGKKEGFLEGTNTTPLVMRQNLLQTSFCPLCQRALNQLPICDNIHRGE